MFNKEDFDGKSICTLPFVHLATHPMGTVTPCCITDMSDDMSAARKDGERLFLGTNNLDEITNSANFNLIRKRMSNNEFPPECKTCKFHENNEIYSKRINSNYKFKHIYDNIFDNMNEDGSLKNIEYRYIELRLGTICNLKCVTCNPFSSNRWNQDVSAFVDTEFMPHYFKCDEKTEWFRDTKFYDDLYSKCDKLEEIWINGGEPTMIREHGYFLNKLIDNGKAGDIKLQYSINMTNIPDDFIDIWRHFKSVKLQLSIDDLNERNDYIRYGSEWNIIYNNLLKILDYRNIFELEICQTVSSLNVFNLDKFKKFALDHDIHLSHNYVHQPSYHHVSVLPDEMKNEIMNNIEYLDGFDIERLKAELFKQQDVQEFRKFRSFITILDNKRNIFIGNFLPEWKQYFI